MSDDVIHDRQSSYSYEDLLSCSNGEMFGAGNAQLPLPPMLMLDRITHISDTGGENGKGEIISEYDINPDRWFFECHFKGDPVMPGCLGLDGLWQTLGFFIGWMGGKGKGRALGVGEVKFTGMVVPTIKKITYHIQIRRLMMRKLVLVIGDGAVKADGETIYTTKDLKVGAFTS